MRICHHCGSVIGMPVRRFPERASRLSKVRKLSHSAAAAKCMASAKSIPASAQFIALATSEASSTRTPGSPAKARSAGMICSDARPYTPRSTHSTSSRTVLGTNTGPLSMTARALAAWAGSSPVRWRTMILV